jgi:hypothetical protein
MTTYAAPAAELVGFFKPGTPDWHAAREHGIGGSEIAAILGMSKWESRFSLWHRKKGLIGPKAQNTEMEAGTRLEPAICRKFADIDFAQVLPSHVKPDTWLRLAQGALKKGRKQGERYELEIAASNNPVFLAAVKDAARLGLEPGTEQYYLTPRKVKGQLEILGIVGYQGYIELMYRAGAISSVVAESCTPTTSSRTGPARRPSPARDRLGLRRPRPAAPRLRLRGDEGRRHVQGRRDEPGRHPQDQGVVAGRGQRVLAVAEARGVDVAQVRGASARQVGSDVGSGYQPGQPMQQVVAERDEPLQRCVLRRSWPSSSFAHHR